MLVDGNKDQIKVIKRVFKRHAVQTALDLGFIHVLEYLWSRLRNRQLEGCKFRRQQVIGPYIVESIGGALIEIPSPPPSPGGRGS